MSVEIAVSDVAKEDIREQIVAPLVRYNESRVGPSGYRSLVVTLKGHDGSIEGGAWGYTEYGWLFVQLLVVPMEIRGEGWGRRVMEAAEKEALSRGCHDAWLDTHEFQAQGFYEKIGYTAFAELPSYPAGFTRTFLRKHLVSTEGASQ